ncbi:MAG: hypothetical protein AAB488_02295 [Patescibacteria group bacterium]
MPAPLFEPRFLNIDFLFNQVYVFFRWVFGGSPNSSGGGEGNSSTGADGSEFYYYSPDGSQNYINGGVGADGSGFYDPPLLFSLIKAILPILSIFLITIIIYSLIRIREVRKAEKEESEEIVPYNPDPLPKHEKWQVVMDHIDSTNPSEWKLAILEADNILDEMIRRMGYSGENLGERLKAIEPSDFSSIQNAWEAHKIRNKIAHEGSEFFLSQREAKRIVGLYEQVFREFDFI